MPRKRKHLGRFPRAKDEDDRKRVKDFWDSHGKLPDDYPSIQCDWLCGTCETLTKHKNWCEHSSGGVSGRGRSSASTLPTLATTERIIPGSMNDPSLPDLYYRPGGNSHTIRRHVLATDDVGGVTAGAAVHEAGHGSIHEDDGNNSNNNSNNNAPKRQLSAAAAARKQTRIALGAAGVLVSHMEGMHDQDDNPNLLTTSGNSDELFEEETNESNHNEQHDENEQHDGEFMHEHDHGGMPRSGRNLQIGKARDDDDDDEGREDEERNEKITVEGSNNGADGNAGRKTPARQIYDSSLPYADAYARELMKSFPRCQGPVVSSDEMNWREGIMCNPTFQFPDPLLEDGPVDAERWLLREAQLVFFDVGLFFPNLFDLSTFLCPMCDELSTEQRPITRYGFVSGFRVVHKVGGGVTLVKQVRYRHDDCEHATGRGHKTSVFTSLSPKVFRSYHPLIQNSYDFLVRPKRVVDSSVLQWIRDSKTHGMSFKAIASVHESSIDNVVDKATRLQVIAAGGEEHLDYNSLVRERYRFHSVTQPLGRRLVRTLHQKALSFVSVSNASVRHPGIGMAQQQQHQQQQQQQQYIEDEHEQMQHHEQQQQQQQHEQHHEQQQQQQEQHEHEQDHEQQQQQQQQQDSNLVQLSSSAADEEGMEMMAQVAEEGGESAGMDLGVRQDQ